MDIHYAELVDIFKVTMRQVMIHNEIIENKNLQSNSIKKKFDKVMQKVNSSGILDQAKKVNQPRKLPVKIEVVDRHNVYPDIHTNEPAYFSTLDSTVRKVEILADDCYNEYSDNDLSNTNAGKVKKKYKPRNSEKIYEQFLTGTKEQPYQCHVCKIKFKTLRTLKSHVHIKEFTGKRLYNCELCNKSFGYPKALKVHMWSHTGTRHFKCHQCEKGFITASSLKIHLRVHNGEKPHKCDVCSRSFSQSSSLVVHLRIHNEEKPFECEQCQSGFRNPTALKLHIRSKHTNQKDFICEICSKGFFSKTQMERHRLSHFGTKPFSCDICQSRYTSNAHLKRHLTSYSHIKRTSLPTNTLALVENIQHDFS